MEVLGGGQNSVHVKPTAAPFFPCARCAPSHVWITLYPACIRRHRSEGAARADLRGRSGHRSTAELIIIARLERARCIAACKECRTSDLGVNCPKIRQTWSTSCSGRHVGRIRFDHTHESQSDAAFAGCIVVVARALPSIGCNMLSLFVPTSLRALCCQRVPPSPLVVNPGSDNGKDDSRSGLGMHTVSPLSNSLHDETLDADEQEAFLPSARADPVGKNGAEAEDGETLQESARSATCGHERVVRVPNETARWVFTNQPQSEDTISMQASGYSLPCQA